MQCGWVNLALSLLVLTCWQPSTFSVTLAAPNYWLYLWVFHRRRFRIASAVLFRAWDVRMLIGLRMLLIVRVSLAMLSIFRDLLFRGLPSSRSPSLCRPLKQNIMP